MSEPQCYFGVQLDTMPHKLRVLPNHWNSKSDWPGRRYSKNITVESWTVRSWRRANNLFSSSTIFWKCVWEKSLILCLDHISALCNKKQISLLMAKELKARKRLYTMFFHDILFVVSVLKNMIGFPTAQVLRTWGGAPQNLMRWEGGLKSKHGGSIGGA